jgi:hypothetical protein
VGRSWYGDKLQLVVYLASCVLYYGFMFVLFLPMGRRRGADLALPVRWRKPWRAFATVVIAIHVLWVAAGLIFFVHLINR